jgi:hypothetical protein
MDLIEKIENFVWGMEIGFKAIIALLIIVALTCPHLVGKYSAEMDNSYDKHRFYSETSMITLDGN